MTTCNRCGKAVGTNDWDIHTCTPKHGCIPKHQALEQMAQNARALGLDHEPSESNKADYQRGYLDGMAKPGVECADRTWVGLTDEDRTWVEVEQVKWKGDKLIAKLKEKNHV